jgi:hypothetical protein
VVVVALRDFAIGGAREGAHGVGVARSARHLTTRGVRGKRARCRRGAMRRAARCAFAWSCRWSASDSPSAADRYQVVVHVDEAALHGGIGRADGPLETVKRLACDSGLVVVTEDERGTPLSVGRKQRTVSTPIRRALWARDRHCTFPGCHRTRFVDAHHVQHWVEGGETSVDNLVLLCSQHHRMLHEGGYRIRRDYRGEHYFVRADGQAIPRCGYLADDYADDCVDDDALENPSTEVREPRGVYRLTIAAARLG